LECKLVSICSPSPLLLCASTYIVHSSNTYVIILLHSLISRYWSKSAHFRKGCVTLSANFRWKGTLLPNHYRCHKTRVFLLPHHEDRMILSSFLWIGYQRVTDGQRDGRTEGRTDGIAVANTTLCIASNAATL